MERTLEGPPRFLSVMADHQVEHLPGGGHPRGAGGGERPGIPGAAPLGVESDGWRSWPPEEEARLSLHGVLSALAPEYLQAPSWSSMWAAAAPSSPWCGRTGSPNSPACLWGPHPEPGPATGRPAGAEKVAALHEEITERLSRFRDQTFGRDFPATLRLVGTAGAVTTLAAIHLRLTAYDPNKINNLVLTRVRLRNLSRLISRLPESERARLPGIEPAKAGSWWPGPDHPHHPGGLRPGLPVGHRRRPDEGVLASFG